MYTRQLLVVEPTERLGTRVVALRRGLIMLADKPYVSHQWTLVQQHPWFDELDWGAMQRRECQPPYDPHVRIDGTAAQQYR